MGNFDIPQQQEASRGHHGRKQPDTGPKREVSVLKRARGVLKIEEGNKLREDIKKLQDWFKEKYNVEVRVAEEKIQNRGISVYPEKNFKKVLQQVEYLKYQLVKIPPQFFALLEVKKIIFGSHITETRAKGKTRNLRGYVSDFDSTVYLSDAGPVHHEFFHIMNGIFAGGREVEGPVDLQLWNYTKDFRAQHQRVECP